MCEEEKRKCRVCFTGHRPEKLTRQKEEICEDLEKEIRRALADGMNVFISGMARGVDLWAAQIVLRLREAGAPAYLICARPYAGMESGWSAEWKNLYRSVLQQADLVHDLSPEYRKGCFQRRNEWMVRHSSRVIAVFGGEKSGTKNTIDYASHCGIPIVRIPA